MLPIKQLQKLSSSQRKIIIVAVFAVCVFCAAWLLVYRPMKKKIGELKKELEGVEAKIKQIEGMTDPGKKMGEGIRLLEERYAKLATKFPAKEEEAVTALFTLASKANIEISSIASQTRHPCAQTVTVEGKSCYEIPIALKANGTYRGLVNYIELLQESLPALVTFEGLTIGKSTVGTSQLVIDLTITIYLLV